LNTNNDNRFAPGFVKAEQCFVAAQPAEPTAEKAGVTQLWQLGREAKSPAERVGDLLRVV